MQWEQTKEWFLQNLSIPPFLTWHPEQRSIGQMFETIRWETLPANYESFTGRDYMLEEHI